MPKIAIIHEWFTVYTGSERVVEQMLQVFPDADLFCLVDFLPPEQRGFLRGKKVNTSFLQKMPFARKKYRQYLGLMPLAIEQFDLSAYDIIISSSHAVAKGVITSPQQLHISYVHSPMRYAWDMQAAYLRDSGLTKGIKSAYARLLLHYIRLWDLSTVNRVDLFLCNSEYVQSRIRKYYHREAEVIYPPVKVEKFNCCKEKKDYYLTASRLVQYKKVDLIVSAFAEMPDKKLVVIGEGPDFEKIKKMATPNVHLLGYQTNEELAEWMQTAKAFIFAAQEDFGITPVEAQACGTPVIAYGKGGSLETVRGLKDKNPTGLFFYEQSAGAIQSAVLEFEENQDGFSAENCRQNAERFDVNVFTETFQEIVERTWYNFQNTFSKSNFE
ncbi:MAG: glycosyl transferase family 1 [Anaerolineaceae bacterium]|nr:glycosyl transferase family 1 [Anaerolineaceae bacterium]